MIGPELEIEVVRGPETVVVALRGELDAHGEPEAHAALERAAAEGSLRVVLDLRGLDFIDSTGLKLILVWHRRLEATDAGLTIVRGPDHVHRPFVSAGVDDLLAFVDEPPA